LQAISHEDSELLDRYVAKGGYLLITGPNPATMNEFGNRQGRPILKALAQPKGSSPRQDDGQVMHIPELIGKSYLISESAAADRKLRALLGKHSRSPIQTDAGKNVHIELRRSGDEILLHLINPQRLWNSKAPQKKEISVSLEVPANRIVVNVHVTSPQPLEANLPREKQVNSLSAQSIQKSPPPGLKKMGMRSSARTPENKQVEQNRGENSDASLPFIIERNQLSLKVPLKSYEMIVISTQLR
jgi:hypothetical protein